MDAFVDTLRCGLSGCVMTDPVIVWTHGNPKLRRGASYERTVLETWLRESGDQETRFGPNTALRTLIRVYSGARVE